MTSPSAITRLALTILCSASLVACGAKRSPSAEAMLVMDGGGFGAGYGMADGAPPVPARAGSASMGFLTGGPGPSTTASAPIVAMQQERKLIYTATLGLIVASTEQTRRDIEELIPKFDGFLQRAGNTEIVFRVAPTRFREAVAAIEKLGEVEQRNISTTDVTDEYVDVKLRIEVAEKSRQRLLDLMDSARETKDILEIERDIRRLTEEIERFEGQLRSLQDRVSFSTITVTLRNRLVDQVDNSWRRHTRFPWMTDIGIAETLRPAGADAPMYRRSFFGLNGPTFVLDTPKGTHVPNGFVPVLMRPSTIMATSADFSRLRITTQKLRKPEAASIDFWQAAIREELQQNRGYRILESNTVTSDIAHISNEVMYGGQRWHYDLWIGVRETKLIVVEYTRLATNDDKERLEALKKSVSGMRF